MAKKMPKISFGNQCKRQIEKKTKSKSRPLWFPTKFPGGGIFETSFSIENCAVSYKCVEVHHMGSCDVTPNILKRLIIESKNIWESLEDGLSVLKEEKPVESHYYLSG